MLTQRYRTSQPSPAFARSRRKASWCAFAPLALFIASIVARPEPASARTGAPPAPPDIWASWAWEPLTLAALAVVTVLYIRGLNAVWTRAGIGTGIKVWQAEAFLAGIAALLAALVSPLNALSSALFSAHMVQHLLLILVAAPLLVLGEPLRALAWAAPAPWRRTIGRGLRTGPLRQSWLLLRGLAVAGILSVLALWIWHIPALYDAALRSEPVHALEHAGLLSTALLFWHVVAARGKRRSRTGAAIAAVLAMAAQGTMLGIALAFSSSPWYTPYADSTRLWHLTPVQDQQIAGLIMWIPAGAVYLGAALALLARLLVDERPEPSAAHGGAVGGRL